MTAKRPHVQIRPAVAIYIAPANAMPGDVRHGGKQTSLVANIAKREGRLSAYDIGTENRQAAHDGHYQRRTDARPQVSFAADRLAHITFLFWINCRFADSCHWGVTENNWFTHAVLPGLSEVFVIRSCLSRQSTLEETCYPQSDQSKAKPSCERHIGESPTLCRDIRRPE